MIRLLSETSHGAHQSNRYASDENTYAAYNKICVAQDVMMREIQCNLDYYIRQIRHGDEKIQMQSNQFLVADMQFTRTTPHVDMYWTNSEAAIKKGSVTQRQVFFIHSSGSQYEQAKGTSLVPLFNEFSPEYEAMMNESDVWKDESQKLSVIRAINLCEFIIDPNFQSTHTYPAAMSPQLLSELKQTMHRS